MNNEQRSTPYPATLNPCTTNTIPFPHTQKCVSPVNRRAGGGVNGQTRRILPKRFTSLG
ncbi:MAG TPA: hypothetical protein PKL52_06195 [Tenuifilaceae bacterium]|nr:hypothetical protein [Tenuifilaceae bacterium]